ncbi:hypothetical protein ACLH0B_22175, partial [Aeromonas salmonicida]|uniref:hypothetical protein n=1 Tax=Aeromonas salmonicida TaxID=645 RepID=UPI003D038A63
LLLEPLNFNGKNKLWMKFYYAPQSSHIHSSIVAQSHSLCEFATVTPVGLGKVFGILGVLGFFA